ncbi:MAG TPA: peptidoglycan DD-metalloendopeptidase family protein [Propionicimonas sp.]|uniref:peptidoglycan DD-metalloendopeptidase family protein n=1 Tax=Propionicimonas sp. TaxID=1955623 RepID=UPI002F40F8C0
MSVVPRRGRLRHALRPGDVTTPRRALVPQHALEPTHALDTSWRHHGRRLSRRVGLILGVALIGGPLAYIVLPQSVAAQPGGPHSSPVATLAAAPARSPAFVAGLIEDGDLIANPVGVVTTGPTVSADSGLIGWPVTDHTPSTGFGYRSDPFTHRQRWHDGVDLGQPCGDPAWASLDGTVVDAGWAGGYGNRVVLRHADRDGHSFATTYNHMARIEVTVGQQVTRGQVVGRIGSTGRSTACHMHFEVILGGYYVDPMRFLTGDMSKAALSRKVGSYMPSGLPSPNSPSLNSTPTTTPTHSTPTPTLTSPTPTPSTTTPHVTPTPTPSRSRTPTPTPTPTTPTATTPAPTTPTPSPATPTPTPSLTGLSPTPTPGSTAPASTPAPPTATSATPAGLTASATPTAPRSGSSPAVTSSSPATSG